MTATFKSSSARRELDHRNSHGIDVTLSWSPARNALFVTVVDEAGHSFELTAEPDEALDVFNHPYAYAPYWRSVLLDVAAQELPTQRSSTARRMMGGARQGRRERPSRS